MAHALHPVLSDNSHLKCGVCNKTGHSNMMFCEKLLSYVLHKVKNWGRVPKVVCKICLNSDPAITPPTCHSTNPPYMCQVSKVNNAICECEEIHEELQNHLHSHFNPAHGFKNVQIFLQAKGSTSQLNSINCAVINHMTLNGCVVSKTSCPAELVEIPMGNGRVFHVKLHYDGGAQHSLAATNRHPIVMDQWISLERITLSTLAGC